MEDLMKHLRPALEAARDGDPTALDEEVMRLELTAELLGVVRDVLAATPVTTAVPTQAPPPLPAPPSSKPPVESIGRYDESEPIPDMTVPPKPKASTAPEPRPAPTPKRATSQEELRRRRLRVVAILKDKGAATVREVTDALDMEYMTVYAFLGVEANKDNGLWEKDTGGKYKLTTAGWQLAKGEEVA